MIRHPYALILATCVTCLSWTLGTGNKPGAESSIAQLSAQASPDQIAQGIPNEIAKPTLRLGDTGEEVKELQIKLKQLGYYNGIADGIYAESTETAVSQFQESVAQQSDGIVGSNTWKLLDKEIEKRSEQEQLEIQANNTEEGEIPWLTLGTGLLGFVALGGGVFFLLRGSRSNTEAEIEQSLTNEQVTASVNLKEEIFESPTETLEPGIETTNGKQASQENNINPTYSTTNSQIQKANTVPSLQNTTRLSRLDIVDELIKDLRGNNIQRRRKAIWELAQRGDSRAVKPLVDAMLDADSKQRSLILEALSQIGTNTLKPMNKALAISLQDENSEVRKNAIRDLTRIYELVAQMSQMLFHALDDPNPEVRETAQWAIDQLGRIRGPENISNFSSASSPINLSENQHVPENN